MRSRAVVQHRSRLTQNRNRPESSTQRFPQEPQFAGDSVISQPPALVCERRGGCSRLLLVAQRALERDGKAATPQRLARLGISSTPARANVRQYLGPALRVDVGSLTFASPRLMTARDTQARGRSLRRRAVRVDEPTGSRWDLALDLLRRGESPISIGPVTFSRVDAQVVQAAVESTWWVENVSEERARADLDQARRCTEELLASDERFRDAVGESKIDYVLLDDYGKMGAVAICRLVDGDVHWLTSTGKPPAG
jgi:hypothetical protein